MTNYPDNGGYQQPPYPNQYQQTNGYGDPSWPVKSKLVAGLLAIFLGSLGIHMFYLGKVGMGILYLLFCWTGIPGIVGFIQGIIYIASSDQSFSQKHRVRVMP